MRKITPRKIEHEGMSMEMPREIYPHFNISLEHLPEAEKWEIGKTYYVLLELKQTDMSLHAKKEEKNGNVGFEITGIEVEKGRKENYKELPDKE